MDPYKNPTSNYGMAPPVPPMSGSTTLPPPFKSTEYFNLPPGSMLSFEDNMKSFMGSQPAAMTDGEIGGADDESLYVGNISFEATEDDLRGLFSQFGSVNSVTLVLDKETGRSRGFAFIGMPGAAARGALQRLDGYEFFGRNIKVNFAKEKSGSQPGGDRGSSGGAFYGSWSNRNDESSAPYGSSGRSSRPSSYRPRSPSGSSYGDFSSGGVSSYGDSSSGSTSGFAGERRGGRFSSGGRSRGGRSGGFGRGGFEGRRGGGRGRGGPGRGGRRGGRGDFGGGRGDFSGGRSSGEYGGYSSAGYSREY